MGSLIRIKLLDDDVNYLTEATYLRNSNIMQVKILPSTDQKYGYSAGNENYDIDGNDSIMGIESIFLIPANWVIEKGLKYPDRIIRKRIQVVFVKDPAEIDATSKYYTNSSRNILCIRYTNTLIKQYIGIGNNLVFGLNGDNELCEVIIKDFKEQN
jgi:hypothetical protein